MYVATMHTTSVRDNNSTFDLLAVSENAESLKTYCDTEINFLLDNVVESEWKPVGFFAHYKRIELGQGCYAYFCIEKVDQV